MVVKRTGINRIDRQHQAQIAKANASVTKAKSKAEKDPLHPIYHLTSAANWINDPNGPIFFNGKYHIFFQHNPYGDTWGNISWGHSVSKDLVRWEHWPIALTPIPDSYDKDGVFSGCCVNYKGLPMIIYTGVWPEVQCIALSNDGMKTWIKYHGNPVIGQPPQSDLEGFRDPFVWKENGTWYMLIGSGIKGKGGTALLYRSKDLINWHYLHPLCIGNGIMWECPNFFSISDKYILIVSTEKGVKYSIGIYNNHKFKPGPWHYMDLGGCDNFYAPNTLEDINGRRIIWGWIKGGGTDGYPWNGMLTLPRIISLQADGQLSFQPAPELKKLRDQNYHIKDLVLTNSALELLKSTNSNCLEIYAEFELGSAETVGITIICSEHREEQFKIGYNRKNQHIFSGNRVGKFELSTVDATVSLHLFLDKSVIETYVDQKVCMTSRYYPQCIENQRLEVFVNGGTARIKFIDIWQLKSIW